MSAGAPAIAAISARPNITAVSQSALSVNKPVHRINARDVLMIQVIIQKLSRFLFPDEVGRATQVCRSWSVALEAGCVWDWQAIQEGVDTPAIRVKAFLSTYRSENDDYPFNDRISHLVSEHINEFLGSVKGVKHHFVNPCPAMAYGRDEWVRDFGDPGPEPRLPSSIHRELRCPDPFQPGKTKAETHLLALLPRTVQPTKWSKISLLTLAQMEEMVRSRNEEDTLQFIHPEARKYIENKPFPQSHWVMMTKDAIKDSNSWRYDQQKQRIKKEGYEVPTVLEAVTCIFLENARSGIRLFSSDPNISWTSCEDDAGGNRDGRPVVGRNYGRGGVQVTFFGQVTPSGLLSHRHVGIAGILRLKTTEGHTPQVQKKSSGCTVM
jgi:hypothetical protein